MSKGLEVWNVVKKYLNFYHHQAVNENIDVKTVEGMPIDIIEKELEAINIISQNFRLVGNCLHAKNEYAEDGWVFVKEIVDEKELEAWKKVLKDE